MRYVLKTDAIGPSSLSMCFAETIGTVDFTAAGFAFSNLSLLMHVSWLVGDSNSNLPS